MNSSQVRSYLTGLILGDGYIDTGTEKRAFRIKSIYSDFIEKIKKDLEETTNFKIFVREFPEQTGKDGTKHKSYSELSVKAHPYFSKLYHLFYNDFRRRIISKKSLEALGWEGWANWFMSDGYICKVGKTKGVVVDRRVELCTDRYSLENIEMLSKFVSEKYGYKTSIVHRGKLHRIRFSLLDAQTFLYNISPFVVPSMVYKLDMVYDYRPTWMTDEYYNLMKNIHSASLRHKSDEEIV